MMNLKGCERKVSWPKFVPFAGISLEGLKKVTSVEEYETNLMSQFIKFYFTSSVLNMFRTLIHPSSGACDYSVVSYCIVSVWQASACHTDTTPTHPHRNSNTHRNKNTQPMW